MIWVNLSNNHAQKSTEKERRWEQFIGINPKNKMSKDRKNRNNRGKRERKEMRLERISYIFHSWSSQFVLQLIYRSMRTNQQAESSRYKINKLINNF